LREIAVSLFLEEIMISGRAGCRAFGSFPADVVTVRVRALAKPAVGIARALATKDPEIGLAMSRGP
jgi:hypothetical protein